MASKTESLTGLEAKARAIAEQMGYELVDVCMDKEPTGKYLRFYIDKEEGVSLDDCEAFHKAVRTPADSVDYDFMEVSSPGIDRPLKKDRDFERNLGCEIEVKLFKPIDGTKVITGVLMLGCSRTFKPSPDTIATGSITSCASKRALGPVNRNSVLT